MIVHLIWTFYRREMSRLIPGKSLTDNIALGRAQEMLDAFPGLEHAQAGFLGLVMDIITGEDAAEDMTREETEFAELVRGLNIDTTPRPGFREEVRERMLAELERRRDKSPER